MWKQINRRCAKLISLRRYVGGMALLGLVSFWAEPSRGQFDLLLSPQIVSLDLTPGSRSLVNFELTNQNKEKPLRIRMTTREMYQSQQGDYKLSDTAMPYSCVGWITLPDSLVEIPPGEMRLVAARVDVPYRAIGGAYGAIVFEVLQEERKASPDVMEAMFEYRFQVPSWFEIVVKGRPGTQRRMATGDIQITPTSQDSALSKQFGDRGMLVSVDVQNTGNVHVVTAGRMVIRDENQRLVQDTRLGGGRGLILPGTKASIQTITGLPPPGKYTIKAFVQYGGRSPAISQSTFEITKQHASRVGATGAARSLYVEYRPEAFDKSIPAGGTRIFGINVMNREDTPINVDVSMGQVFFGMRGQMWVSEEQPDTGRSCIPWLKIDPLHFTLAPSRAQNLRASLTVPADAKGGYYGCIILNAKSAQDSGATTLPSQLNFPIILTVPPDLERSGEVAKISVDQQPASSVVLSAEFRNTGNVHARLSGNAEIQLWRSPGELDSVEVVTKGRFENLAKVKFESDTVYVLPGQARVLSSQVLQGFVPGRYRAIVEVFYGEKKPATLEREFVIKEKLGIE